MIKDYLEEKVAHLELMQKKMEIELEKLKQKQTYTEPSVIIGKMYKLINAATQAGLKIKRLILSDDVMKYLESDAFFQKYYIDFDYIIKFNGYPIFVDRTIYETISIEVDLDD